MGITQRLANRYPRWVRLRNDPSSFGQRFYSSYREYFDFSTAEAVKLKEDLDVLKRGLGVGELYVIDLDDEDIFTSTTTVSGGAIVTYPSLVTGDAIELPRDEYLEDMLFGIPSRMVVTEVLDVSDWIIWDSTDPTSFAVMSFPSRLIVNISESEEYLIRKLNKNRYYRNRFYVKLVGKDLNSIPVTEKIEVLDDGTYESRHIFSQLDEVEAEGFDGDIVIKLADFDLGYKTDPFRYLATSDMEGPLYLTSEVDTGITYLSSFTNVLKRGWEYRTGDGIPMENTETLLTHILRDSEENDYEIAGFAISPDTTRLYTIGTDGIAHVYDYELPAFTPPQVESDKSVSIMLLPLSPYETKESTEYVWTWFGKPHKHIVSVTIKRISPTGVTRYLQADKTWGVGTYSFSGMDTIAPDKSWIDFRFATTYTALGQWEYYAIVVLKDGTVETSQVSVMVPHLDALVDIDLSIVDPTGMFFYHTGELGIATEDAMHLVTQYRDTYYADPSTNRLFIREDYNEIEVTI